jgi:hypothetical protein
MSSIAHTLVSTSPCGRSDDALEAALELGATRDEEQDHVEWAAGAVAYGDAVR